VKGKVAKNTSLILKVNKGAKKKPLQVFMHLNVYLSLPGGIVLISVQASSPTTFLSVKKEKKEDYF
jgi:hypothetical protein